MLDGERMLPGHELDGPAIVDEATTTVVVPEGFRLSVDRAGSFVLHRTEAAA